MGLHPDTTDDTYWLRATSLSQVSQVRDRRLVGAADILTAAFENQTCNANISYQTSNEPPTSS